MQGKTPKISSCRQRRAEKNSALEKRFGMRYTENNRPLSFEGIAMTKNIVRITTSVGLLILTGVMVLLAKYINPVIFSFYPALSRSIVRVLATMTSVLPVPLCELLLAALIVWMIVSLIRDIVRRRLLRWVTGVLLIGSLLLTAFVGIWGLNYYAPPMNERLKLPDPGYTAQELAEATSYYLDMANEYAPQVARNADGTMCEVDFDTLSDAAGEGYGVLGKTMDEFDGTAVGVKKLLSSPIQGKIGMTGAFICLTGESCVSTTTYTANLPFPMCHEIGHAMAFARENEANFAAFLACSANESPVFRYSGYYSAFRYCFNALWQTDRNAAQELQKRVCAEVKADILAAQAHYAELENDTAKELTDQVYDSYLKSFSVESGVQSYGEVTDLLLSWYFTRLRS